MPGVRIKESKYRLNASIIHHYIIIHHYLRGFLDDKLHMVYYDFLWFIGGGFSGNGETMSNDIISSIESTVTFVIGLTGLMCFWCGVMKVAEKSGFTEKLAKVMKPILKLIFKDAAKDEKALGAIVMNITANMMGLGNAATPFGIKAMEEMDTSK